MKLFAVSTLLFTSVVHAQEPAQPAELEHAGILAAWKAYDGVLTFGKGQTLALLDDGCTMSKPEWQAVADGVPKVRVTFDAVDGDNDPKHEGKGYHGTTIGIPSSVNHGGKRGVAYNNQIAVVRSVECCHCKIKPVEDAATELTFRRLDLTAALRHVMKN